MFQLKNKGIDSEVGDKWNLTLTVRDMYNLDRQYWPLIDVAKLFCALLVVMIHCVEIQQGHLIATFIVHCFSGQAVPFFMIVSGFFATRKIEQEHKMRDVAKLCIKNWLLLYFVWSVLWLPYYFQFYQSRYPDVTIIYILLMIIRRVLFAGQGVYWYLLVLAEAVFVIAFFVRQKLDKALYCISIIGLILGILYDANVTALGMRWMHQAVYAVFSWSNNLFMKGIPYVAIGYFLRRNINRCCFNAWKTAFIYVLASIGMIIIHVCGWSRWLFLYPIQAVFLFIITYQNKDFRLSK